MRETVCMARNFPLFSNFIQVHTAYLPFFLTHLLLYSKGSTFNLPVLSTQKFKGNAKMYLIKNKYVYPLNRMVMTLLGKKLQIKVQIYERNRWNTVHK